MAVLSFGGSGKSGKGRLSSLFNDIGAAYDSLIARGRENDAFRLRDATQKFAAAGSKFGVNQFARTRAMDDLKAEMMAASGKMEAGILADKLRSQAGIASELANIDQREFQNEMAQAQFSEQQRATLFGENFQNKQFEEQKRATLANEAARNAMISNANRPQSPVYGGSGMSARSPVSAGTRGQTAGPDGLTVTQRAQRDAMASQIRTQQQQARGDIYTVPGPTTPASTLATSAILNSGAGSNPSDYWRAPKPRGNRVAAANPVVAMSPVGFTRTPAAISYNGTGFTGTPIR